MAKIEDLIRQVSDAKLRDELASEVRELKKQKRFGLVFEEHLPERLRLPKATIRVGNLVAHRDSHGSEVWRVIQITGKKAKCRQPINPTKYDQEVLKDFPLDELVLVVSFGEPIYPVLTPIDRVERGGPEKPWHILINADNYHALQLLLYSHERKIDLIYIDPPYNTGARDWKYNNDYVDTADVWRHSKWLSMMKKRLTLAKRLLTSDGVLICAVDDYEVHHLIALLEEVFAGFVIETLVIIHHPQGAGGQNLSRVHEYAVFCMPHGTSVIGEPVEHNEDEWSLQRSGTDKRNFRRGRPNQFYALHVDPLTNKVVGIGPRIERQDKYPTDTTREGLLRCYPIDGKQNERVWRYERGTMQKLIDAGKILRSTKGTFKVRVDRSGRTNPIFSVWSGAKYNAGINGSSLVDAILGHSAAFTYPKSLYNVADCVAAVVRNRPRAVILDFFAGSGTTCHATCYLNTRDEGRRQCILITNNELPEEQATALRAKNLFPGDREYEAHGIAESVTWPRCKFAIQGRREDGTDLGGEYLDGREMSGGFEENMEYFRLDFVDPTQVERGDAFEGILPILWMIAGAIGERESRRGSTPWYLAKHSPFAVLIRETKFSEFQQALRARKEIACVFLVTDSDDNFAAMRRELGRRYRCTQLYKSYLENFRINAVDPRIAAHEEETA